MLTFNRQQLLIFDQKIVRPPPAPPAPMARIAVLFDLDQHNVKRQPRMRKNAREMNQLIEQIEQTAMLGAVATADDAAAAPATINQPLLCDDRLDDPHPGATRASAAPCITDGRQRPVLHLDQFVIDHRIDPIFPQANLGYRRRAQAA